MIKLPAFIIIVIVLGVAGRMDLEDQLAKRMNYCERVNAGIHEDFKHGEKCQEEKND